MSLDDLPLRDRPTAPPPEAAPSRTGPSRLFATGAAILIAVALLALWWLGRAQPEPVPPAYTAASDLAAASARPKPQPLDLPPLNASDALLRQLLLALSTHPTLARLLATDSIVRGATLAVVQIGEGRTPADPLKALRPATRLSIAGPASGPVDPANYRRWNAATAALVSLPPAEVAQVYVNVKLLCDEAYRDLGFTGGDFDRAILKAIRTLNDTPQPATEPLLLRRPGYFEHDDPALRALLPVQRQFLLIGPDNRRQVLAWLGRVASSLDLSVR
jgi:Protein of unknown function (DUF3014)